MLQQSRLPCLSKGPPGPRSPINRSSSRYGSVSLFSGSQIGHPNYSSQFHQSFLTRQDFCFTKLCIWSQFSNYFVKLFFLFCSNVTNSRITKLFHFNSIKLQQEILPYHRLQRKLFVSLNDKKTTNISNVCLSGKPARKVVQRRQPPGTPAAILATPFYLKRFHYEFQHSRRFHVSSRFRSLPPTATGWPTT